MTAATLGAGISVCRTRVTSSREFVTPDVDARSYFCWEHSEDVLRDSRRTVSTRLVPCVLYYTDIGGPPRYSETELTQTIPGVAIAQREGLPPLDLIESRRWSRKLSARSEPEASPNPLCSSSANECSCDAIGLGNCALGAEFQTRLAFHGARRCRDRRPTHTR